MSVTHAIPKTKGGAAAEPPRANGRRIARTGDRVQYYQPAGWLTPANATPIEAMIHEVRGGEPGFEVVDLRFDSVVRVERAALGVGFNRWQPSSSSPCVLVGGNNPRWDAAPGEPIYVKLHVGTSQACEARLLGVRPDKTIDVEYPHTEIITGVARRRVGMTGASYRYVDESNAPPLARPKAWRCMAPGCSASFETQRETVELYTATRPDTPPTFRLCPDCFGALKQTYLQNSNP